MTIIITSTRMTLGLTLVVFLILFVSIPIKVYGIETLTPEQQLITKSYHRLFEVVREMGEKKSLTEEQVSSIITYISTKEFRHEFITAYTSTNGFTTNKELVGYYQIKWFSEFLQIVLKTEPITPTQEQESEITMFGTSK